MSQNINVNYGLQQINGDYVFAPLTSEGELVDVPLNSDLQYLFTINNQNLTWNWEINLTGATDAGCAGTFYIDASLDGGLNYQMVDNAPVTAGEFAPGDPIYMGVTAPSNLSLMRIRWVGTATTATARIKMLIGLAGDI